MEYFTQPLGVEWVEYYLNYIVSAALEIIALLYFGFEIVRYVFTKQMNLRLFGDCVANFITYVAYPYAGYLFGVYLAYEFYYVIYAEYSITQIPINLFTLVVAIILADLIYYWEHRFTHRTAIGWATHTVHHSSPEFNISVAYRFGPMDSVWAVLAYLPMAFMGFHPGLIFAAEILVLQYQTILHTETIPKLHRWFEFIFNTPSHHRVHHGSNKQYHDKNYGGMFIIWDRIFNTFAEEKEQVKYGITKPINSVNPLVVFCHGFPRLAEEMKNAPNVSAAIRLLFPPPGYLNRSR